MEDLEPVVVAAPTVDAKVRVCADIICPEPSEAFDAPPSPSPPRGASEVSKEEDAFYFTGK